MKTTKLFIVLIITSFAAISLNAQSENEITYEMLFHDFQLSTEKWRLAYNSKDAQNLVPLYTDNADYISSHVEGLEANGRDKLIANFQNGMNMGGYIDSIEILKMNVSCDMATLLCKYQATNNGVTVIGRNLLVMKKIDGIWLIALHITVV